MADRPNARFVGSIPVSAGVGHRKSGSPLMQHLVTTTYLAAMVPRDVIASGDKAVARVRMTGTHKGPFVGMPATGRRVEVQLIDIMRFGDDGRARELWGVVDQLAMLQQLGAVPAGPAT